MTDRVLIERKLEELEKCLSGLESLRVVSLAELDKNIEKQWAAERGLQIAVQVLIDIGAHILSSEGETGIEDYAGVIERLGAKAVIPEGFAAQIKGMAGLRNILVHEYADVDLTVVYNLLQNRLDDFRVFAGHINEYLKREK